MSNFYIAQVFGVLGIIFSVLSMQMKTKKNIMLMFLGLNTASALNFFFLESYSGCYVCLFGILETVINFIFDKKNKKVPLYVIGLYIVVNIILGLSTYNSLLDIIPIACAILYCFSVSAKKEQNVRNLMFGNQALWLVYDIKVKAYMFSCSNILTLVSYIIASYKYRNKSFKK